MSYQDEMADKRLQEIEAKNANKTKFSSKLQTLDSIMAIEFPEVEWLIEKLIPAQGITIISGAPASFKTFLMWQMSINIAEGTKFLDQFECAKTGILIIDEENRLRLVKKRFELLGAKIELPITFLSQENFSALDDEGITEIIEICKQKEIGVIFIDSLIRISNSKENDAQEMAQVFKALRSFCKADLTVVITHHERKEGVIKSSPMAMMRGSTDIPAAVDCHLAVKRDKNDPKKITILQPKLREDEEIEPFCVRVIKEPGKTSFLYEGAAQDDKEEDIREAIILVLEERADGLLKKEVAEEVRNLMPASSPAVKRILTELIEEGAVLCVSGKKNEKRCFLPEPEPATEEVLDESSLF